MKLLIKTQLGYKSMINNKTDHNRDVALRQKNIYK